MAGPLSSWRLNDSKLFLSSKHLEIPDATFILFKATVEKDLKINCCLAMINNRL
jgi:hypothetical protein